MRRKTMKRIVAGCAAAMLLLVFSGALLAHHNLAQFDTTKAVRIRGVVVRFEQINPHSILFVDQKVSHGETQRWALEGPGVLQITRKGLTKEMIKVGDIIQACGYVTKDGIEYERNIEPISLDLKAVSPKTISGKLMDTEQIVLPDGQKIIWSDYGHHKCLGSDYIDFHSR